MPDTHDWAAGAGRSTHGADARRLRARVRSVVGAALAIVVGVGMLPALLLPSWDRVAVARCVVVAAFLVVNVWWVRVRALRAEFAWVALTTGPRAGADTYVEAARRRARWLLLYVVTLVGGMAAIVALVPR